MIETSELEPAAPATEPNHKQPRGLALLSAERRREIASAGGKQAHRNGRAHKFSSEEGRRAGKKGGWVVSCDRDYMRSIGRRGGLARAESRAHSSATHLP